MRSYKSILYALFNQAIIDGLIPTNYAAASVQVHGQKNIAYSEEMLLMTEDVSTTLNIYSHFNKERLNTSTNDLAPISEAAGDIFS